MLPIPPDYLADWGNTGGDRIPQSVGKFHKRKEREHGPSPTPAWLIYLFFKLN